MELGKYRHNTLMRVVKPAQLIDRNLVALYIDRVGTPVCACCDTITFLPVFRVKTSGIAAYCVNCGITRDTIGTCLHVEGEDMTKRMINPKENFYKLLT